MKALEDMNRRMEANNRGTAEILCRAADAFREAPSPKKLFEFVQDGNPVNSDVV
jgi:hypothetical protein